MSPVAPDPLDLLETDALLDEEARGVRDSTRAFVQDKVLPSRRPVVRGRRDAARELFPQLGDLGLLGMHLEGYGCAGASATAYGVACRELEAGDSGLRSFVSVQGSLAMFPIHAYGSEEQKQEWLPRMAAGTAVGCFGLTEPDRGSDPGDMQTRARRDGGDWVLNGAQDVDHQRAGGRRGRRLGAGGGQPGRARRGARLRRTDGHGRVLRRRDHAQDVAAGLAHRRAGDGRRAAAGATRSCPACAG